jgi:SAM-dependent methyltransferase
MNRREFSAALLSATVFPRELLAALAEPARRPSLLLLPQDAVERLTCVEIDRAFADSLSRRMSGHNVTVVRQDATAMSFPDATFDGAVSFTMLHHVPSEAMQNRLLAEVARVLRPGGVFAGTDSLYSRSFRLLHLLDTMVVVDPCTFPERLRKAGFADVQVDVLKPYAFRFRARKATITFLARDEVLGV